MTILKTTELYIFKERTLWYVNYMATFEKQQIRSWVSRVPVFGHGGTQRIFYVSSVGSETAEHSSKALLCK